jgi:membrane-associated phospholipid phosphatase
MLGLDTWGLDVVLWFQSWRTPPIESLVLFFHEMGQLLPYMLLLPVFFWCVERRFGARLAAWFVAGVYLNSQLKALFGLPRPYFDPGNGVQNIVEDVGFGLPSGHAQNATVFWGLVSTWARRKWVWGIAAILAGLMGLSRVVAGVHFPQDVLAGWLLGAIWIAIYLGLDRNLPTWLADRSLGAQVVLAITVGFAIAISLASDEGASYGGAMLGLGVGLAAAWRWVPFDAGGVWWRRLARYGVGLVGLLILQFGLSTAFATLQPALVLRTIRFALMGTWITLGAPWAFLRLGLAEPEKLDSPPTLR